jgi:glycine/D-amino acid oxidase-like deaminating enzyme
MKVQHFYVCGDLIFRASDDNFLRNNRANWDKIKAKYEMLKPDEVRYRYPQFSLHDIEYVLYEPDAGTVRARRSCESVAAVFRTLGGELQIARAWPTAATKSKMPAIQLSTGEVVSAGTFVFACGPWLPKVFPNLLGRRIRTPMGSVYYFGPRPGDHRFQYPNCPTWNFPGTTGWPALPDDNSGFRIRAGGGASGTDPDISQRWVPPEALERAKAFAAERFPPLKDCPVLRTHSCHYESGVGRNFMIDLHPDASNVWIVGSGMAEGFKFGPAIGEYAANRILGRDREPELECSFRIPKEEFPDADTSGFGQGQGRGRGQGRGAGQAQGRGTVQGRGRAAGGGGGGQAQAGGRGEAQGGARAAQGEQTQGRGQGRGQAQQQQQFTPIRACAGPVDQ